jgi:hypothetical protein
VVKLSEIYLGATREKAYLDEVEGYCNALLKRDPNSYDGHRLTGDLDYVRATEQFKVANKGRGAGVARPGHRRVSQSRGHQARAGRRCDAVGAGLGGPNPIPRSGKALPQRRRKGQDVSIAYTELYRLLMFQGKARRRRAGVEAGSPEQS